MPSNVAPRFWPEDHATVFILIENSQSMSNHLAEIGGRFIPEILNMMSSNASVRLRSYPDSKHVVVKALADTCHVLNRLPLRRVFLDLGTAVTSASRNSGHHEPYRRPSKASLSLPWCHLLCCTSWWQHCITIRFDFLNTY